MLSRNYSSRSRLGGLALALVLAFAAQYLFTGEVFTRFNDSNTWVWQSQYTLGSLLLIAAFGCAVWSLAPYNLVAPLEKSVVSSALSRYQKMALTGAGICYVITLSLFSVGGENTLVRGLWVLGMALLILPLWLQSRAQPDLVRFAWWEWASVIAVTGLGFVLRYWQLTEIPSFIHHDVPLMGAHALQLIETGNFNWVGVSTSEHLLSYDQSLAWSMRLFGTTQYGLVMKSVLFGTASLPLVYLLGREMYNSRVGLIAMALLTTNYTHIHFSRILFGSSVTFFALLIFYYLYRGLRTKTSLWYALAGLATGVGMLLYDSSRVVPVIVLALVIWRLVWERRFVRANIINWCFFALGALIGFGPMLIFALTDFSGFMGRGNGVTLWTPDVWQHAVTTYGVDSVGGVVIEQVKRALLAFHLYGDGSPHFAFPRPGISALAAALFVIGLGYCLQRLKQSSNFLIVAWYLLTFIFGGILTYDPPYWPHLNIALPAVMLIAALAADRLIELWSPPPDQFGHLTVRLLMGVALAYTGWTNWEAYYNFEYDSGGPRIRAVRFLNELPEGYNAYLISDANRWDAWQFQFFTHDMPGQNLTVAAFRTEPPASNQPSVFVVYDHYEILPLLYRQYPNGVELEHHDADGRLVFTTYTVTPEGFHSTPRSTTADLLRLPGWWFVTGGLAVAVGLGLWGWWRRPAVAEARVK